MRAFPGRPYRMRALSLRHLLVLLTAIGLLPLALLGVWSIHAAGEYRQREQERALLDLARALSTAVDAELDSTVAALSTIGHDPAMGAGDIRAFHEEARLEAQGQREWLGVFLADEQGRTLFRTNAPFGTPAPPPADPDSLARALSLHRPVVGSMVRGKSGRPAFPVRLPLTDSHGRSYVLTAVIRPDRILRVIERQRIPADSVISVLDAGGRVVARSKDQDRYVTGPVSPSLQALMRGAQLERTGLTLTLEGLPVLSAFSRMSRYGWTVAIGTPAATVRGAFLESLAVYGAGIALSLGLCIALAYWLAGRIVADVNQLRVAAAALVSGKAGAGETRTPPSRIHELRQMARALDAGARQRARQERERAALQAAREEAQRRQNEALEQARQAGQAKDEFLAVLGHELRNPLSPIVASLDLMDLRDEPGARRERAIMRRQVTHLKRLVDDLLDVSRIASGKLCLELRPMNLADTVRHALAALPDQGIALEAPAEAWVEGDESRLVQVLSNLLSNAVRFGGTDIRVTLDADSVHGLALLAVQDNGVGMDGSLLGQVFEPFYQAPQQLARRTGGLGLGLAIVRKIVELHGGHVSAASAGPGRGSRFEVVLPLAPRSAAPPGPEPLRAAGPAAILLVDDNVDAAASTASLLEGLGHRVSVAYFAAQALEVAGRMAGAGGLDAAILDIGLPDMDGYALAGLLRARHGAALRLIALSGYGQQADVERALQAGFDLHLTKPAQLTELARALAPRAAASAGGA